MNREQYLARIAEIDKELDKTMSWENPPYRYARVKLRRERARLLRLLSGNSPSWHDSRKQARDARMHAVVVDILRTIER